MQSTGNRYPKTCVSCSENQCPAECPYKPDLDEFRAWFKHAYTTALTIHSYRTGEALRQATPEEATRYLAETEGDTSHTGAVDGADYGYDFPIYM